MLRFILTAFLVSSAMMDVSNYAQSIFNVIFPVFAIGAGIFSAFGIWFPRFRCHWKGTRMACGPLSCAGFALFFISMGVVFLAVDLVPERHRIWFAFPAIIGWILGAVGYSLDVRSHS